AKYDGLEKQAIETFKDKASRLANANKCADLAKLQQQARNSFGPGVASAIADVKCEGGTQTASNPGNEVKHPVAPGSNAVAPPPKDCDADALTEKGRNDEAIGQHGAALKNFANA